MEDIQPGPQQRLESSHVLADMIAKLRRNLGEVLQTVVLYGSSARGESWSGEESYQLIIVVSDLEPPAMRALREPVRFWLRKGLPMPKLFSPALMADAADVFPLEFLEIKEHHEVLFGRDPFVGLSVHTENLRLQCERDMREKMMRLREGYMECHGSERQVRRLLWRSYPTFVEIFRGCLRLGSDRVPLHDDEVVRQFCRQAEILHGPLQEVEEIMLGEKPRRPADELFQSYYSQLSRAVDAIDQFEEERPAKQ